MSIVTAFRSMVQAVYPYWFFAMRCCFQAPQQWCWGTGPQFALFCFFFCTFFLSDRPSQNQETHSKLNEKKVQLMRFHLNGHTAQFCPQIRKLELHTKWIVLCESTTWIVTLHGFAVCRFTSYLSLLSKGGAVVRALTSHQCGPGSNPGVSAICGLSLFVVGSLPCSERFFSGYSGFPLSLKTNTSKFQFDLERSDTFQRVLKNS